MIRRQKTETAILVIIAIVSVDDTLINEGVPLFRSTLHIMLDTLQGQHSNSSDT